MGKHNFETILTQKPTLLRNELNLENKVKLFFKLFKFSFLIWFIFSVFLICFRVFPPFFCVSIFVFPMSKKNVKEFLK